MNNSLLTLTEIQNKGENITLKAWTIDNDVKIDSDQFSIAASVIVEDGGILTVDGILKLIE